MPETMPGGRWTCCGWAQKKEGIPPQSPDNLKNAQKHIKKDRQMPSLSSFRAPVLKGFYMVVWLWRFYHALIDLASTQGHAEGHRQPPSRRFHPMVLRIGKKYHHLCYKPIRRNTV